MPDWLTLAAFASSFQLSFEATRLPVGPGAPAFYLRIRLDADNRGRVLDLVASLCTQRKSTVLMVTHRADERAFWQARIGGAILSLS